MNVHLIEPYNAYQKKPLKKKHPTEIAEEEALFIKTMIEEQRLMIEEQAREAVIQMQLRDAAMKQHLALREAAAQKNLLNQNLALPQYAPQPASQQVQDGQFAAPAGGGGWAVNSELEKEEVANFTVTPSSGYSPLTVTFANYTRTPDDDTFLWNFGTGSLTSTDITPSSLTYVRTGSYIVTLQATSSAGVATSANTTITVLNPVLVSKFTLTTSSNGAPSTGSFTNTTTYTGNGTLTYKWLYGSGSLTSSVASPSPLIYINSGSYTASLQVTESSFYGYTSVYTRSFRLT